MFVTLSFRRPINKMGGSRCLCYSVQYYLNEVHFEHTLTNCIFYMHHLVFTSIFFKAVVVSSTRTEFAVPQIFDIYAVFVLRYLFIILIEEKQSLILFGKMESNKNTNVK